MQNNNTNRFMAFKNNQKTQYAWILNQYIEKTVTFASQLVQLQKIAGLSSNNFFERPIQMSYCKWKSRLG